MNFTKEIPLNFFSEKNHPQNFPKFQPQNWQVRHHFFKNSLQEGVFENSWKFLQLVQTFTPITNLLCTFSSCSDLSIYLNYNIYKFHQIWRTKNGFTFHFTFTFTSLSLHFHFHKHGGRRSIAGIAQHYTLKYSTCKTSAGANQGIFHHFLQGNPFTIFPQKKKPWNSASNLQGNPFTKFL